MAKVLVTGGAGFIGSALVHRFMERGDQVRVLDNFSTGFRQNLADVQDRVEILEGDVAEMATAEAAVRDVEWVVHEAAIPSVQRSVEDPVGSNHANITGTLNMLVAARATGKVRRFVYASSSSAYGDSEALPKVETMRENPISPYALTKFASEKYCVVFHKIYGLPTVSLRYFNIFGPRQNPNSPYSAVISRFINYALDGKPLPINGDGEQSRDFTFVENVVSANVLACTAEGVAGQVFNIGTGGRHTLNDMVRLLATLVGHELNPVYGPARTGDVRHSLADIGHARRLLGYEPKVKFEEGLRQTFEWYRKNR